MDGVMRWPGMGMINLCGALCGGADAARPRAHLRHCPGQHPPGHQPALSGTGAALPAGAAPSPASRCRNWRGGSWAWACLGYWPGWPPPLKSGPYAEPCKGPSRLPSRGFHWPCYPGSSRAGTCRWPGSGWRAMCWGVAWGAGWEGCLPSGLASAWPWSCWPFRWR
jgi:hypothetical protein